MNYFLLVRPNHLHLHNKPNSKTMKKHVSFLTVLLISSMILSFTSCKKGEDDPFLSLKSRNSRLKGEWVMKEASVTETYSVSGVSSTTTTTYNGTQMTETDASGADTWAYTYTITFEKDGTYSIVEVDDGSTVNYSGTWAWGGKNKSTELKNKEVIHLTTTQETHTGSTYQYTGVSVDESWQIQKLASKEMIVKVSGTYSSPSSTSSVEGTITFEKK